MHLGGQTGLGAGGSVVKVRVCVCAYVCMCKTKKREKRVPVGGWIFMSGWMCGTSKNM